MGYLREYLLETIHNLYLFFKGAVARPLSNFHATLDYRGKTLRPHEEDGFEISILILLLFLNVSLSLDPDIVSVVNQ